MAVGGGHNKQRETPGRFPVMDDSRSQETSAASGIRQGGIVGRESCCSRLNSLPKRFGEPNTDLLVLGIIQALTQTIDEDTMNAFPPSEKFCLFGNFSVASLTELFGALAQSK